MKNENFIVAGLVVFLKQNLIDCASSVYVGFYTSMCVCLCSLLFLIFHLKSIRLLGVQGFR